MTLNHLRHPNPKFNIFTFRFTIPKGPPFTDTIKSVVRFFESSTISHLIFRETSKQGTCHYHARATVNYKKSTLYKKKKEYFPELKGNKMFAIHPVYIGGTLMDEDILKSYSYIAKEGCLISQSGYTHTEINTMIEKGKHIMDLKGSPLYIQIIKFYKISNLTYKQVAEYIIDYYTNHVKKIYLPKHVFKTTLHKIQRATNEKVKQQYHTSLIGYATYLDFYNTEPPEKQFFPDVTIQEEALK